MMKSLFKVFLLPVVVGAAAFLAVRDAGALTWVSYPSSFLEIITSSSLAFRGKVTDISYGTLAGSARNPTPYTKVTFEIERGYVACQSGETVSIYHLGGKIPGSATKYLSIPGIPHHRVGDRTIVFANDRIHPITGTLWGDLGLRRVVKGSDGQDIVLSDAWRPLVRGPIADFVLSPSLRCKTNPANRAECVEWVRTGIPRGEVDGNGRLVTPPIPEQPLGLDQFEAGVLDVLARNGHAAGPAQTVTASDESFQDLSGWLDAAVEQGSRR